MVDKKLYHITSESHQLPYAVDFKDKVIFSEGNNIPVIFWPDGRVCWEANLFIRDGYNRNLSRKNRGGTLLTHAKQISHLIRFCYDNRINFLELTNNRFKQFINNLKTERDPLSPSDRRREDNQVVQIGRTCLAFLNSLDKRIAGANLLGPAAMIHAEQRESVIKKNGGNFVQKTWWHDSFPSEIDSRRRLPLSDDAVEKLYMANEKMDSSRFINRRRFTMLRLFEITGGRRIEISHIKISDIEEAAKTGELRLFSAKKRDPDATRFVPVNAVDIEELKMYIKIYRKQIVTKTIGLEKDHGYLFISQRSGTKLSIDSLGNELWHLRQKAGIENEEICLHAFRHRFITRIFKHLIQVHDFKTTEDIKAALASTETIKQKVMEWSGHSSLKALERYMHLAIEQIADLPKTIDVVRVRYVIDSALASFRDLRQQLKHKNANPTQIIIEIDRFLEATVSEMASLS
jgi:integrase